MTVTIKDVAKKAGVSPSTVSRVIHNNPRISSKTVARVRQTMAELKYQPNAAARSLAKGKTYTLGLIIPSSEDELFVHPFFISAMRGLSIIAQRHNYNIMYFFSSNQEEEVAFLNRAVRMNLIDGVILTISREDDKCMDFLEDKNVPYVLIGRPNERYKKALWVDSDNFHAMYNLVTYFLNQGKRRIVFMGGSRDFIVTQDRFRGYCEALRTHGVELNKDLTVFGDSFLESSGYVLIKDLFERVQFDAIATTDDVLAFGAMDFMAEQGEYIPIAGFNNSMKARILTPGLTSVDIMPEKLGMKAAERLIDSLENSNSGQEQIRYSIVETRLIERDSTHPEFVMKSKEMFL